MARRRYLDESRPSMDYVRAMINNTDPETGRVNYGAINVPWNNSTSRRSNTTRKKSNTKWTPKTKSQALASLGETKEYTISSGDTLSKIDSKHWRDIAIANGISDPNKIKVGQKILIPKNAKPSESTASESTKVGDVSTPMPSSTSSSSNATSTSSSTPRIQSSKDLTFVGSFSDSTVTSKSTPKSTSQDYGASKIGLFTTQNIVPRTSTPTQEKASNNLSTRVQNGIAAFRQYAKDNGIDLSKPKEKSAARRGWDAFINSFVPSVNADPSGGYHAYTNEQFWKDNTGEEMPSALRQTVGQNLKVAGAAAASIGAPAALEALGATVGAPISDAIMATRGGQIVGNVLTSPYTRALGTAYGLSRLPFDAIDGDYINAALDVVPFGAEAWNAARSVATGTNMTRAGNWFGFSKNINPGGTRISNPISVNTTTTKIPFKPTTSTTQTRFPIWYLRGKMPMYDHYTGTTKFVNSDILEGSYNQLGIWAKQALPYGKERMLEPYPTRSRPLGFRSDVAFISPADNARGILQNMQPRINLSYNGVRTAGYASPNSVRRPGIWRVPQLYEQPVTVPNPVDPAVGEAVIMQNPQLGAHSMQPQLLTIDNYFPTAGTTQFKIPSGYNTPRFFPTERRLLPSPTKGQVKTPRKPRKVANGNNSNKRNNKPNKANNARQLKIQFSLGGAVPLL